MNMRKNILWNAAGNLIYMGCQWLMTILVVSLSQNFEDAGILSLAMTVSATFQTVALFGIRNYQVSDLHGDYSDSCYVGFRTLTCALAMLLCMAFSLISGYRSEQLLAIFLFMLFRLAENFSDVLHGIAQRNERLDIAGKAFTIKGIGLLLLFLLGYGVFHSLTVGLLLIALFSCSSTFFYDFLQVRKLSDFRFYDSFASYRKLSQKTLPLCAYLFLFAALSSIPKLILEWNYGDEILGAYSSIFAPAMLLQAATGYLYAPFATKFAEYFEKKDIKNYRRLLLRILGAVFAIFAVILLLAYWLGEFALVLIFKEQIQEYVYLLIPILLVNLAISLVGFFCMLAIVLRRFAILLIGCGVGAGLCLVLGIPMIRAIGPNGASYSLIISSSIAAIVLLFGTFFFRKDEKSEELK